LGLGLWPKPPIPNPQYNNIFILYLNKNHMWFYFIIKKKKKDLIK